MDRLTKLELIDRLGDAAFKKILELAKVNIDAEAFVVRFQLATPDADGTSIYLRDPRTIKAIQDLGAVLVAMDVVSSGWVDAVLYVPPSETAVEPPALVTGPGTVFKVAGGYMTVIEGGEAPVTYEKAWQITHGARAAIEGGAIMADDGTTLTITLQVA